MNSSDLLPGENPYADFLSDWVTTTLVHRYISDGIVIAECCVVCVLPLVVVGYRCDSLITLAVLFLFSLFIFLAVCICNVSTRSSH